MDAKLGPDIAILLVVVVLETPNIEVLGVYLKNVEIVVVAIVPKTHEAVVITVVYENARSPALAFIGMPVLVLVAMATAMP